MKIGLLLKKGLIVVMPTDTIYGICGTALKKSVVEKIYKLRKRSYKKPMIVLISSINDLKIFGVELNKNEEKILKKLWPGKISVILELKNKIRKFAYIHRGTNAIAFRLPKPKWLIKLLKISGPIVAPSANWEGYPPAKTIEEAKKYFGNKVIYWDKGKIDIKPSTLIKMKNNKIEILRKGAEINKVLKLIRK
ncbi:MAG: L-threonylcarbamoyladenylate synthase [Candidatus Aenigmatarchaeota archaeon]